MRLLLIIGLLLPALFCKAQKKKSFLNKVLTRAPYDSSYVDSYYDYFLHVTLVSISQDHNFDLISSLNTTNIEYASNNAYRFGLGLDYRYFSIEYTRSIDAIDKPDPNKGNTESFSLRLGITGRRFLGSLLVQRNEGMYIANPEDYIQGWDNNMPYPKRPDILSEIVFGSLNYFFNHKLYSTMASLWQIDRQKKSAGSFVTGIATSASRLQGDSSLIPQALINDFPAESRVKENTNYLVGINVGYGHNFIFKKKFFCNLLFIPGLDLQYGNTITTDNQKAHYRSKLGYHGDLRIIGGYNGEEYYCGAHYSNYFLSNNTQSNVGLDLYNSYFRIFAGKRFNLTPKQKR